MRRIWTNLVQLPAHWRWLIWLVYMAAWTVALEVRRPELPFVEMIGDDEQARKEILFLFAKTVHVSAYALLAVLTGWLRPQVLFRWCLLVFLVLHACLTEYMQYLLPFGRSGSVHDVALDLVGIGLGVALSWKWWLLISPEELAGPAPWREPLGPD